MGAKFLYKQDTYHYTGIATDTLCDRLQGKCECNPTPEQGSSFKYLRSDEFDKTFFNTCIGVSNFKQNPYTLMVSSGFI
jgi:hypothetical protein